MKVQKIVCFLLFGMLFLSSTSIAQKLSISQLINTIYKSPNDNKEFDSVLFFRECNSSFFIIDGDNNRPIKVLSFSSKDTLKNYLKLKRECFLFKADLLSVGNREMALKVGMYKASYSDINEPYNFLVFVDERTIVCRLSKKEWKYHKSLNTEDH